MVTRTSPTPALTRRCCHLIFSATEPEQPPEWHIKAKKGDKKKLFIKYSSLPRTSPLPASKLKQSKQMLALPAPTATMMLRAKDKYRGGNNGDDLFSVRKNHQKPRHSNNSLGVEVVFCSSNNFFCFTFTGSLHNLSRMHQLVHERCLYQD